LLVIFLIRHEAAMVPNKCYLVMEQYGGFSSFGRDYHWNCLAYKHEDYLWHNMLHDKVHNLQNVLFRNKIGSIKVIRFDLGSMGFIYREKEKICTTSYRHRNLPPLLQYILKVLCPRSIFFHIS
jgi:hypothetical protein